MLQRLMSRRSAAEVVEDPPRESLLASLHENWAHARHQEQVRERHNYLYWVSWAAVLAFASTQKLALSDVAMAPLYVFLMLFSAVAVFATLKWTAEFTNHIAAAYRTSLKLGLVEPVAAPEPSSRFRWLASVKPALPYPPRLTGYMALPLDMPIYLNVGATMAIVQALGFAASVALFVWSVSGKDYLWLGLVVGAVGFLVAVVICFRVMKLAGQRVREWSPLTTDRLPVTETARVLGAPEGTIKSRVHHALQRLRASYEAEERR
ncbi:MAG: hypothetical protein ABSC46_09010 [Candidatus Limnocylindrales bacterium]